MTHHDLDAVRGRIREQVSRAKEVRRRLDRLAAEPPAAGSYRGLKIACTKGHRGNKKEIKIAEVRVTSQGIFYIAGVPWAHSDATRLRPWTEESHLLKLFWEDDGKLDDDELLANAIDNLQWWRERGPGDLSWIADRAGRSHRIVELLDLPQVPGRLTLWARCPSHLDDYEAVEPTSLLRALR